MTINVTSLLPNLHLLEGLDADIVCLQHSGQQFKGERERLLGPMRQRLRAVPIIIAGDFNTISSNSASLKEALSNGWSDAAELQARASGASPCNTCYHGTPSRIDLLLTNSVATHALCSVDTFWTGFATHMAVKAHLNLAAFTQRNLSFYIPKPIPTVNLMQNLDAPRLAATIDMFNLNDPPPSHLSPRQKIEFLWSRSTQAAERYLSGSPNMPSSAHHGRGLRREARLQSVTARSAPEGAGADNAQLVKVRKILGRTRQYAHLISDWERRQLGPGALPHALTRSWDLIRKSRSFLVSKLGDGFSLPVSPPSAKVARRLAHEVTCLWKRLNAELVDSRHQASLSGRTSVPNSTGKEAFAWIRDERPIGIAMLEREDCLTADLADIDAEIHDKWNPILRMYTDKQEPDVDPFLQRFGTYVQTHNCQLSPLTVDAIREIAQKKSSQTSCGVDGWRMREIAALPDPLLSAFVEVFDAIEEHGIWPDGVLDSLVTLIPKGEGSDPLKLRPITVTSALYRIWASARLKDVLRWQEKWIHASQHGFRPKHSCDDVVMDIALELERALLSRQAIHGIALDFSKCFDRIPQRLVLSLAKTLGLHLRVLRPLENIYQSLRRRFKYPLGLGREFEVTNGILQGCPISIVLINALVSVLSRAIEAETEHAVHPRSYADDIYLLARACGALQKGVDITEELCRLTGLALNKDKSVAFSSDPQGPPAINLSGGPVPTSSQVKVLGVPLGKFGPVTSPRVSSAIQTAARLEAAPLNPYQKLFILQAMASSTFYGAAYLNDPIGPSKSLEPLRTALSACLIPRTNKSKSTTATLAIIAKAHLCEPLTAFRYHAIRTFLRMYQKDSVASRIDALVVEGAGSNSFGPVGIATRILRLLGFSWSGEGFSVIWLGNRQFSPRDPSALAPLLHEAREALRKLAFREIESKRSGFSGIADGVDVSRVNVLWQKPATSPALASAIRRCLVGAVYSREWCSEKWGNCEPLCEHCSTGATGSLDHYYWSCPHWDGIRARFSDVTTIAASLPDCLRLRGIPTRETDGKVTRRVQHLLGSITHAMSKSQRALTLSKP